MKKNYKKIIFSVLFLALMIIPSVSFAEEKEWYIVGSAAGEYSNIIIGKDFKVVEWGKKKTIPGFSSESECETKLEEYYDEYDNEQKEILGDEAVLIDRTSLSCEEKATAQEKIEKKQNTKTVQDISPDEETTRDDSYELLAPIGGLSVVDKNTSIGDYLNQVFVIGIGLAGALAVIMIVIYGVVYMGSESVFGKTQAKERIMMSIGGLILALGSYVILNTINPDLIGGTINVGSVSISPSNPVADESVYDSGSSSTSTCGILKKNPGSFGSGKNTAKINAEKQTEASGGLSDLKELGFVVKNNSKIQKPLADKLVVLKNLGTNYSITEAFKATTYAHVSKCHYLGSCVDVAFRGSNSTQTVKATPAQVRNAIVKFREAGLFAQFEVGTKSRYNELGITDLSENGCPNVITVSGVAEHFSVYLKS